MSLETVAAAANPLAAVPAIVGRMAKTNFDEGRNARKAQEKLEAQRRATLASEAADREAAKKRAETTGQRAGFGRAGVLGTPPVAPGGAGTLFGAGPSLFGN